MLVQVVGILSALGSALAIARCVEWNPGHFLRLVRLLVAVLVFVAVVGLIQFVLLNVLNLPAMGDGDAGPVYTRIAWFALDLAGR